MKRFTKLLLAAALATAASSASAVILTAGVHTDLPGTSVALKPHLAGVVLEDVVENFSFSSYGGTVSGTVQSRVVRSTVDGTLDFYWRITSDTFSSGPIGSFRLGDFFTSSYDADWRTDGLGNTAPQRAYLFPGLGGNVNFLFGSEPGQVMNPGNTSYSMFFDTNATSYSKSAFYDLTGESEISGLFATFAPTVTAIPEPGSSALLALGFAGLALVRRRKAQG